MNNRKPDANAIATHAAAIIYSALTCAVEDDYGMPAERRVTVIKTPENGAPSLADWQRLGDGATVEAFLRLELLKMAALINAAGMPIYTRELPLPMRVEMAGSGSFRGVNVRVVVSYSVDSDGFLLRFDCAYESVGAFKLQKAA